MQPLFDYESKATYQAEFESMRSLFLTLGGALSLIIGWWGVLNFLNAVLTGHHHQAAMSLRCCKLSA